MSEQYHNPLKTADIPNHGNHLNGLSTRQDRAPMALLDSPSTAAAARLLLTGLSHASSRHPVKNAKLILIEPFGQLNIGA
jgi:hypothetical protein